MFRGGEGGGDEWISRTITLNPKYGELKITSSVSIIGMTRAATLADDTGDADILEADDVALLTIDADGASRVMSITTKTDMIDVVLENLTLTGGDASNDGVSQGGAMYVKNANLTLTGVAFIDNTASYGGAVFLMDSIVTMTDVTMTDNTGNWGGAIYQTGGELKINSGDLSNNFGQRGGAIYQDGGKLNDGKLRLDNVTLIGNTSTWGGGLYQAGGSATLTENTKFEGNSARRNFGSVLVKSKGATLTINGKTGNEPIIHGTALSLYLDEVDWM